MARGEILTVATIVIVAAATVSMGADGAGGSASLARLKEGNARVVASTPRARQMVRAMPRQEPFAAVLSCADARVPPEAVFDAAPGDLFVVRAAGHVADRAILASLEYAVERLHVPLLIVMGHDSCDLVRAAVEPAQATPPANLEYLLKAIRPSAARASKEPADVRLRAAILMHVEETINQALEASTVLRRQIEIGRLLIAGAYYDLATGHVHFSEPVRVPPRVTARGAAPVPAAAARKPAVAPAQGPAR